MLLLLEASRNHRLFHHRQHPRPPLLRLLQLRARLLTLMESVIEGRHLTDLSITQLLLLSHNTHLTHILHLQLNLILKNSIHLIHMLISPSKLRHEHNN
jgi:hypothetical protein